MNNDEFNAAVEAYKTAYFSAKDDRERRDKINAFRAGYIYQLRNQNQTENGRDFTPPTQKRMV